MFLAQVNCGVHPAKLKPWVHRLSKGGVEGMEEGQSTAGNHEEGQSSCRPVQKDSNFVRAGWAGQTGVHAFMPGLVAIFVAVYSPGRVILTQPAVIIFPLPAHPFVGYSYESSPTPFGLPVAAFSQTLRTQHLHPEIKPLWVFRIWLCGASFCFLVSLRKREVHVGCVWIQGQVSDIWWS